VIRGIILINGLFIGGNLVNHNESIVIVMLITCRIEIEPCGAEHPYREYRRPASILQSKAWQQHDGVRMVCP
jgi:hypothetical protein